MPCGRDGRVRGCRLRTAAREHQSLDALTAACEITHVYGRAEALDVIQRSRADYMARYAHLAQMLEGFTASGT